MSTLIDYDRLTAEFSQSLVTTLRGHKPAADYLEIWVPDEDPVKGILNMVEAAQVSGQDAITLQVSGKTLPSARHDELRDELAAIGNVQIESVDGKTVVSVAALNRADPFASVAPAFREPMRRAIDRLAFSGSLPLDSSLRQLDACSDDLTLSVQVNDSSQLIARARHSGGHAVEQAVMDALCQVVTGVTVDEAADHGAIRAMQALTDRDRDRPVPGILLPRNADPAFAAAERLIRRLRDSYHAATGHEQKSNEFETPPAPAWCRHAATAKRTAIVTAMTEFLALRGLPANTVAFQALETDLRGHDIRVVIGFAADTNFDEQPALCRALERHLKDRVEPQLQIFVEEVKDRNAIRRL